MIRICSLWSTENVNWKDANWTFDECQTISEVCRVWSQTADKWNNAEFIWRAICHPTPPPPSVAVGNLPGVDASTLVQPWLRPEVEPWNPYKKLDDKTKKKFIKIICKVKGQEYSEQKEARDFNITVDDIKMTMKKIANIDLDLKL
jgi:hypothetical protein